MKKIMLTGDRPTGRLHLGHYIGSLKNRVELQDQCESIFIIADLHMLTTKNDYEDIKKIKENARQLVLDALACGINPDKVTFYQQSKIPEINEIYTLFQSLIGVSRLERVPSLKEMAKNANIEMPFALLGYPILQAADILCVKAHYVPVGKDNLSHVEITREIALKFNNKYSPIFPIPKAIPSKECTNLPGIDGLGKMSKSANNVINLTDTLEDLKKKVMKMPTDPNRIRADIPGNVENNLVFLYHDLFNQNKEEVNDLKERYQKGTVGDVEVKEKLIIALNNFLEPFKERYQKYNNNEYLDDLIEKGSKKVRKRVQKTLKEMKEVMGFYS
ncbi:MAG: tryptophan--tRNA ligase [Bacilli bacterium]|jgi:tryptophanyl-tRNA synthetase